MSKGLVVRTIGFKRDDEQRLAVMHNEVFLMMRGFMVEFIDGPDIGAQAFRPPSDCVPMNLDEIFGEPS